MSTDIAVAAAHWNAKAKWTSKNTIRFWQSEQVVRHINRKVCGEPLPGFNDGLRQRLKKDLKGRILDKGISIGCGTGGKEMWLLEDKTVAHFDLYEIAETRIEVGREMAVRRGLSERTNFILADAFAAPAEPKYDIVYWDGSLHHMLDVHAALTWSKGMLKAGGWIVINEFVGGSRFQFSKRNLDYATKIRSSLPAPFLENGVTPGNFVPCVVKNVDPKRLIAMDPTEAADSEQIIPAARRVFPEGEWIMLGGAIYHVGLNDILWNFERYPGGQELLGQILICDDLLSDMGENHYALFMAQNSPDPSHR